MDCSKETGRKNKRVKRNRKSGVGVIVKKRKGKGENGGRNEGIQNTDGPI